jgi:hypothetical protein
VTGVLLSLLLIPVQSTYEVRSIEGWTLSINHKLLDADKSHLETALKLLTEQLVFVKKSIPAKPLKELRAVPLYLNPEYKDSVPAAAFHPGEGWLKANGRDVAMVRAVEFYNIRTFKEECIRMPVFVLHELAHAYHFRVLGFGEKRLVAAYEAAKKSGMYDSVDRWFSPERPLVKEKAYGMNNVMEYFAESTEAYFGRNDFYPFTRAELEKHDPEMARLLGEIWK